MDVCAIKDFNDVINLFPKTVEEINARVQNLKIEVKSAVQKIIAVPDDKRTFDNTVQALDTIGVLSSKTMSPIGLLREVSPEESMRNASYAAILEWQPFVQEEVSKNIKLFEAFKAYFDDNAKKESLTPEQRYYLDESMKAYVREGLLLPSDKLAGVKKLQTELVELALKFSKNIADVDTKISFSKKELDGVPESILASLKKDATGNYLAGMDYPTVFSIMKFATNGQTRKKMYEAFQNRAYPVNFPILKEIMDCRARLAHLLGFKDFVAYDLDNTMAKTSQNVQVLLQDVMERARNKGEKEIKTLVKDLPSSVKLTEDNKLLPWDVAFLKEEYKKKNLNIDDKKLTEYFPVEHVVPAILSIYENFLGLRFEEFNCNGLWHSAVKCIRIYDNGDLRGFLILDLYPRPNKYSHACMVDVISPRLIDETVCPAVIAILANFPEGSKDFPGLLKLGDVRTFFHEFGHAMHGLLSATHLYGFSGVTSVKFDFVETPSQMFEEWLNNEDILKKLSHHYKTGESLPNDIIEKLIELDKFDAGDRYLRQIGLSLFSLRLFDNSDHDIQEFYKEIMTFARPNIVFDDKDHGAASFGHLTEYASKYYSYLWAQIYSMDLFETIKKQGLLNSEVGKKVAHEILSKGGSVEPAVLLKKFLGRESNQDAFLRHFGFES